MPSSPNYKRNYKQEYATETTQRRQQRAERTKMERVAAKVGISKTGDNLDLDHIRPLSKGGPNTLANIRAVDPASNRSILRSSNGAMKSQLSKRERKKSR